MLGPVQFVMIGLDRPHVPEPLRERIVQLHNGSTVDILDVLFLHKDSNGVVRTEPFVDMHLGQSHESGAIIDSILSRAAVARTLGQDQWSGPAHLFRGDLVPDPRSTLAAGSSVLALLLDHRWAIELREAAAEVGTHPVANGWIGRDILREVGLLPQDSG
jgi:hypothetical protein